MFRGRSGPGAPRGAAHTALAPTARTTLLTRPSHVPTLPQRPPAPLRSARGPSKMRRPTGVSKGLPPVDHRCCTAPVGVSGAGRREQQRVGAVEKDVLVAGVLCVGSGGGGGHRGPFAPPSPPSLSAVRGGSARGVPYLSCQGGGGVATYMTQNDPHVALIVLNTHFWRGKLLVENFFSGQNLCSGALGANIRCYTKQWPRHGTQCPPHPPSAIVRAPPPPPTPGAISRSPDLRAKKPDIPPLCHPPRQ